MTERTSAILGKAFKLHFVTQKHVTRGIASLAAFYARSRKEKEKNYRDFPPLSLSLSLSLSFAFYLFPRAFVGTSDSDPQEMLNQT